MPCWKPACSVTTGASCRPATNDVRRCAGAVAAPGSPTPIAGPKLMISVMSADGTSRRRSGPGVTST
jgi:hypothetical protein